MTIFPPGTTTTYIIPRPIVWTIAGILLLVLLLLTVLSGWKLARCRRSRSNEESEHEYNDGVIPVPALSTLPSRLLPATSSKAADVVDEENYSNMELTKV
jgi:hypothetical protein